MDIGDQWYIDLFADLAEGFSGIHGRDGHTYDVGTGVLCTLNLRDGRGDIRGFRVGHGLNGDRGVATHWDITDPDFTADPTFDRVFHVFVHRGAPASEAW